MKRGEIYPIDRAEPALANFISPCNLIALREIALQQVSHVVDRSLESYLQKEQIEQRAPIAERFGVCISSNPAAQYLMGRAARMAQRIDAELYVLYIDIGVDDTAENRRTLQENLRFAENLGAQIIKTTGKNVAQEVAKIVKEKHITQVVFGRSAVKGWKRYLYLSAIHKFLRDAPAVDVHIVTQEAR
jgi:two-component system sensor histidine kinase KdpD